MNITLSSESTTLYNMSDVIIVLGFRLSESEHLNLSIENAAFEMDKCIRRLMNKAAFEIRENVLKVILHETDYNQRVSLIKKMLTAIEVNDFVPQACA